MKCSLKTFESFQNIIIHNKLEPYRTNFIEQFIYDSLFRDPNTYQFTIRGRIKQMSNAHRFAIAVAVIECVARQRKLRECA